MISLRLPGVLAASLLAVSLPLYAAETAPDAAAAMQRSFEAKKQAGMDRLQQDEVQALCTRYTTATLPAEAASSIQQASLATVKPPSDGQYLGDYKAGEQIAQTGTGLQSSDDRQA